MKTLFEKSKHTEEVKRVYQESYKAFVFFPFLLGENSPILQTFQFLHSFLQSDKNGQNVLDFSENLILDLLNLIWVQLIKMTYHFFLENI